MPFIRITLLALAVLSAGCTPSLKELEEADYGTPLPKEVAERIAKEYLESILLDPESLRTKWRAVERGWWKRHWFQCDFEFGYVLAGEANAKNRFGGYVGMRPWTFCFRDGKLRYVYDHR